ncbi:MAG: hypothetical protein LC790_11865 [Actinobacteria bacterium]|nr:hypothetical protein [Actinomycetota bacterium]
MACRLINQQKSAEMAHREPVALDEHAQALTVSVSGELGELTEDARAVLAFGGDRRQRAG